MPACELFFRSVLPSLHLTNTVLSVLRGLAPLVDELGRPVPLRPATSLDLSRHTLSPTIVDPSTSSLSPRLQEAFSPTPPLSPELATSSNRPSNRQKSKKAHPRRRRSGTRAHRRSSSGSSSSASSTGLNAIRASPSAPELRHSPPRNHLHARTYSRAPHSSIPTPSASRTRQHHQKKVSLASHSHSTGTIYVEAPVSVCEAIVAPKPRLAPRSLHESPHVTEADGTAVFKATFDDEDQQEVLRRSIDASSMRRVLRENEESRKEREGWSDSGQSSSGFAGLRIELGRRRSGKSRNELGGLRPGDENRGSVYARRAERRREREAKDAARSKGALADASPDLPSSFDGFATPFDGFTGLVRKLSRSRERRPSGSSTPAEEHHGLGISRSLSTSPIKLRRRRSNAPPLPSSATFASLEGPAFVGDKPIRHLRSSASVDSLYTRPSASISARQTHYGEAVTNAHSASATPAPTLLSQNAVLSLPPHLHHLLRAPLAAAATSQDDAPLISPTFIPQRAPPPAPTFPRVEALSEEIRNDRRHARSSSESAAALVLALDRMFDEEDQLRAKEAQLFHDELTLGRGAPLAWRERGDVPVVFPAVTTPSPPPFPRPLPFSAPISRPSSTGFGHSLPPPPRPRRPRPSSRPTGESSNSDPASTTSSTRNPVSPLLQDLTDTLGPRRGSVEAGAALEGSPIGDSPGSHGTPTSVAGRSVLDLDEEDWTFDNLVSRPEGCASTLADACFVCSSFTLRPLVAFAARRRPVVAVATAALRVSTATPPPKTTMHPLHLDSAPLPSHDSATLPCPRQPFTRGILLSRRTRRIISCSTRRWSSFRRRHGSEKVGSGRRPTRRARSRFCRSETDARSRRSTTDARSRRSSLRNRHQR